MKPETLAIVRLWKAQTEPPDGNGWQEGGFIQEPRITWRVRSFKDKPEERQYFFDGDSVADLDEAVARLSG